MDLREGSPVHLLAATAIGQVVGGRRRPRQLAELVADMDEPIAALDQAAARGLSLQLTDRSTRDEAVELLQQERWSGRGPQ
jgi:hypothetical protein